MINEKNKIFGKTKRATILISLSIAIVLLFLSFTSAWNFPTTSTSSGSTTFLQLTDTPSSYSGSDGLCLLVNETSSKVYFGSCTGGGETDPKWSANYSNHLIAFNMATNNTFAKLAILNNGTYSVVDTDSFTANYSAFLTHVTNSVLNNGSYFNTASSDSFVGNYSTFLTHITFGQAGNGTLAFSSQLNNGTYIINSVLNNGSYFNGASGEPSWEANYTNFLTDCITDNYAYGIFINGTFKCRPDQTGAGGEVTGIGASGYIARFNATSSINNSIIFENGTRIGIDTTTPQNTLNVIGDINGTTVYSGNNNLTIPYYLATNNTFLQISNWNATNTSYYLASNPAGFFHNISNFTGNLTNSKFCTYNSTDNKIWCNSTSSEVDPFWSTNYSDFLNVKGLVTNNTFTQLTTLNNGTYFNTDTFVANYSDFLNVKSLATNNTFAQLITLNNGTYFNTDTFVANYSNHLIALNMATNNTFTLLSVLNNGTYTNTDTFVANYSTFLTHISNAVLNNGSYFNGAETDPQWTANYSAFIITQSLTTNNTFSQYQFTSNNFNGTGYFNTSGQVNGSTVYSGLRNLTIPYYLSTNNTFALLSILNNGTYSVGDTFVANYSNHLIALNMATNNTFVQYQFTSNNINGTGYFNTSGQVNGSTVYSGLRNLTIPYYLATNNTFAPVHANTITTNATFVLKSGDVMTGGLNTTTLNSTTGAVTLTLGQKVCWGNCSQWMLANVTGVFIQG